MRKLDGVIPIINADIFRSLKQQLLLFDKIYVAHLDEGTLEPQHVAECKYLEENNILVDATSVIDVERAPQGMNEATKMLGLLAVVVLGVGHLGPLLGKLVKPEQPELDVFKNFRVGGEAMLADLWARLLATQISNQSASPNAIPICRIALPYEIDKEFGLRGIPQEVLNITLENFPTPDESSSWEDIQAFRAEMADKQWGLRRFLADLTSKDRPLEEIRDDIEWSLNEYTKAMNVHKLKSRSGFFETYIIPVIEIAEDLAKFNWSKIAKGALSVKRRQIELMEVEMKAPGREVAYIYDAQRRFGT